MDPSRHWVEELFPAHFTFGADEVTKAPEKDDEVDISTAVAFGKRISPLDVSAIKNVYERVRIMTLLAQEDKEHEEGEKTPDGGTKHSRSVGVQTEAPPGGSLSDSAHLEDSCIWNSKEIEILRDVFKKAKTKNGHLKVLLEAAQNQVQDLETKCSKQTRLVDKRTRALGEASKANARLQIMCENLKTELASCKNSVKHHCEDIEFLTNERNDALSELVTVRKKLQQERLQRQKMELDMEAQQMDADRQQTLTAERLKFLYEKDIEDEQQRCAELEKQLQKEREEHARSKNALEHLRRHFSSLPLTGVSGNIGVVTKDQIDKIEY